MHTQNTKHTLHTQASFEPLGLTIAVAKDRAIESMMQVGAQHLIVSLFGCGEYIAAATGTCS